MVEEEEEGGGEAHWAKRGIGPSYTAFPPLSRDLFCFLSQGQVTNWAAQ